MRSAITGGRRSIHQALRRRVARRADLALAGQEMLVLHDLERGRGGDLTQAGREPFVRKARSQRTVKQCNGRSLTSSGVIHTVATPPKPWFRREVEWQTVLRRVLDLPARDQLELAQALTEYLGVAGLWKEDERARQMRLRAEAMDAVRAAAEYLQLPAGQAPKVKEFQRADRETKLPMRYDAVLAAFEGQWRLVARYFRGETIPATAAQRAMLRKYMGRRDGVREAPLTGVRLFLTQDPPPAATRLEDYDGWAREFNEHRPPEYMRVNEHAAHICIQFGVGWDDVLAAARGHKDLEQAREASLELALANAGPLIANALVCAMLGVSTDSRPGLQAAFPQPVFYFTNGHPLWCRSDIDAYLAGRRDFTHEAGVLQEQYLDTRQLGENVLGVTSTGAIRQRVNHQRWETVPEPLGKAGDQHYWSRADVEAWLRERPRQLGPLGTGPKPRAV